ncbi:hypothetical protein KAI52_02995 [Candidatus Parcubacteria bacterium]|nr:hypothetical protein [Candidatus Parcubacteria bacterium]
MAKDNLAKQNADINRRMMLWSCDNENNLSSNYSNFLTTLAGFFIVLSPLVINDEIVKNGVWLKIFLSISIVSIFLSLIFGGIYIFLKKNFFSKWIKNYSEIFNKWNNCSTKDDEDKILACEECIYKKNKTESPQWPLITQTILLLFGMFIIITIIIKILIF